MNDFLNKIRESNNDSKRLWLFLFSGITMFLVAFVWLKYFNFIVSPGGVPQPAEQNAAGQGFTFWQTFKAGLAIVFQNVSGAFQHLFDIVREPRNYIIKP